MSHEIRTPLNAIVGFSSVLDSAKSEKERKEYLHIIEHNNQLLLQLINDIIDLSKIEAGTLEFVNSNVYLDDLMQELERMFRPKAEEKKLALQFDDLHMECYVNADRNRLMQVMNNLLSNAIKFTSEGSIHFGFSRLNNGMLRFYVADTGCGVPEEYRQKIFGRFVKLNSFVQGIGLGLSICDTIVRYMNGEIGVESNKGKGSVFLVYNTLSGSKRNIKRILSSLYSHTFPIEIKHPENLIFVGCLIDTDISDFFQQGEVDYSGSILFIVQHQSIKLFILLAIKCKTAVILFYKLYCLPHLLFRKPCFEMR